LSRYTIYGAYNFGDLIFAKKRPVDPKVEADREMQTNSMLERQQTNFCSEPISCAT